MKRYVLRLAHLFSFSPIWKLRKLRKSEKPPLGVKITPKDGSAKLTLTLKLKVKFFGNHPNQPNSNKPTQKNLSELTNPNKCNQARI